MGRTVTMIALALGCALSSGCGETSLLSGSQSPSTATAPRTPLSNRVYLSELSAEQAKLAAAEKAIPRRAKTPMALSKAITLLGSAISQLGSDLASIRPPAAVATLHARIVSIVRAYAAALARAGGVARRPGGELRAGDMLIAATGRTSRAFSATIARIDAELAR